MEKVSQPLNEIGFRLSAINTEQFATFDDFFIDDEAQIGFNTKYIFRVFRKNTIQVLFEFELVNKLKDKASFIKLCVKCDFDIRKNDYEKFITNTEIILPHLLIVNIVGITIGIARGILHEKTFNTKFNKFPLPLIDISTKITNDLSAPLSELQDE